MLNKYFVLVLSLNKEGGNYEEITRKDTYTEAENLFFTKCSQYAPNPATGYVVVELLDDYGRAIKTESINRLPEPETETTEE
jgi:hypothetical protein